jgi:hypothetical protein
MGDESKHQSLHLHVLGRSLSAKNLAAGLALVTLLASLVCGIVGLFTTTVLFEAAVLLAVSTGLAYIVIANYESKNVMADMAKAMTKANHQSYEAFMDMAKALGKLTPIPVPDHVFRHASHALKNRITNGGWNRICLYAPAGVWMPSAAKDQWLDDVVEALKENQVGECWGVYGLPRKSEAAAWNSKAVPRLSKFIDAECTQLHYLPEEDARHPGAARGLGIIILESYGQSPDYTTIFLFIGDSPRSRGGFMIEDQIIGSTIAKWFDSQVFNGCSAGYILRPLEQYKGETPAQFMTRKLGEISSKYPSVNGGRILTP